MNINNDLRQRHLRDLNFEIKRRQPDLWQQNAAGEELDVTDLPLAVYYDVYAKSAIAANWVEGLTDEQVDDMTWQEITELVAALDEVYSAATMIKKN